MQLIDQIRTEGFKAHSGNSLKKGRKVFDVLGFRNHLEQEYKVSPVDSYATAQEIIEVINVKIDPMAIDTNCPYVRKMLEDDTILAYSNNSDHAELTNLKTWHSTDVRLKNLQTTMLAQLEGDKDLVGSLISDKLKMAMFEYDPYTNKKFFLSKNGEDSIFNRWIPPRHFFNLNETKIELPQVIDDFFFHLFNGRGKEKRHWYDWLANSLKRKNRSMALFAAAKGIGKNYMVEQILSPLVGEHNISYNRNEDVFGKFNESFVLSHFALVDEFAIKTTEEMDAVKRLSNDTMAVEEKHKKKETKKIKCNMIFCTNRYDQLRLDDNQRRFNIYKTTDTKLGDNTYLMEKYGNIDNLTDLIHNAIPSFYKWLLARVVKRNLDIPFVNEKVFNKIQSQSFRDWEQAIVDYIDDMGNKTSITLKDLKFDLFAEQNIRLKVPTIENFIKNQKLGKIVLDDNKRVFTKR